MLKYWYIFKSELMSSLQYAFNLISRLVGYWVMLFIFMNLWKYMYSDPNEVINDYSMSQMIWYVVITELIYMAVNGRKFCRRIIDDVRGGNLVYNLNKPYNYINYLLFSHLGEICLNFVIYGVTGIMMGYIFIGEFPKLTLLSVVAVLITMILAIIINTLLTIFIGLFSFIIEDSTPFYWIYSKLMLILGTIFPIEFFPKVIQKILNLSPIYANSYGPARLFVNFNIGEFGMILISQIIYIFIGYLICYLIYRKGVRKLNVNGG